jgi:ribonuclease HII
VKKRLVLPEDGATYWAGIDENGLGPVLGPLVVTGVLVKVDHDAARAAVQKKAPKKLRERLGDSKQLVTHEDDLLGEAWARTLAKRLGRASADVLDNNLDDLVDSLLLDPRDSFLTRCPSHHDDHCWARQDHHPEAPDDLVRAIDDDLDALAELGITIVDTRAAIICNRMLNDAASRGISRFTSDLHAMERLILRFRDTAGERINATCGKVGGFGFYDQEFGPLAGHLRTALAETRKISAYEFPGVARVSFVMDADEDNLLVSMASLVGKWMRDTLMRKIVAYYKHHDERFPDPSGYHDPVTRRFIDATSLVRKHRRIEDKCFLRERLPAEFANATSSEPKRARSKPQQEPQIQTELSIPSGQQPEPPPEAP